MNRTHTSIAGLFIASCLLAPAGTAVAAGSGGGSGKSPSAVTTLMNMLAGNPLAPDTTGQPNQNCANFPSTPGNSASAPGSAFNPNGKAGTVYAGQQPQNSRNPKSVSQYDVACSKQPPK